MDKKTQLTEFLAMDVLRGGCLEDGSKGGETREVVGNYQIGELI